MIHHSRANSWAGLGTITTYDRVRLRVTCIACVLPAVMLILLERSFSACDEPKEKKEEWISLFDGKSLGKWRSTQFGGEADVSVEDGIILLPIGEDMTGITWRGDPPARMNYEIELEAKRVDGNDFFCGLTFPVGKEFCSLICGGWGGGGTVL